MVKQQKSYNNLRLIKIPLFQNILNNYESTINQQSNQ